MVGVYKITSPVNGVYIGKSKDIESRWKQYKRLCCKTQPLIYYSLLKYGVGTHKFEIIQECEEEALSGLEYKWWQYYTDNNNKMLNCKVPIYETTPDWVKEEIMRQELETIIHLRIRVNIMKKIYFENTD